MRVTFCTVETLGGDRRVIDIDQVTHLTALSFGTQVHFASGEQLLLAKPVQALTIELIEAAASRA